MLVPRISMRLLFISIIRSSSYALLLLSMSYFFFFFFVCDLLLLSSCRKIAVASCVLVACLYTHTHCLFGLSLSFVTLHLFSIILNSAPRPFSATVRHIHTRTKLCERNGEITIEIWPFYYY